MGSVDGTNINPDHLAYRWKVEMKKGESIKEEGGNKIGDRKIEKKKYCSNPNQICNVI